MKLTEEEVQLYFDLMWSLLFFAKEQLELLPEITTAEELANSSAEEKIPIREKLFEQREIIDAYVSQNPDKRTDDQLQIVQSWKNAVVSDFYIERMLKKYTVFISSEDDVYGVYGLYDAFDEIIHKSQLPTLVKTILLPFKGKIIYDGLLQGYRLYFGGGVKGNLKEIYMTAKQNGRIIETLGDSAPSKSKKKSEKPQKDWSPELDVLAEEAKKLRGGKNQPILNSPTFSLIKASIEMGQLANDESQDVDRLWEQYDKLERHIRKIGTILSRME